MRRLCVPVAVLAAAVAAGCGDDSGSSRSDGAKPVGRESGGSVVQLADCGDWRRGTEPERYATVEALRGQLTPQLSKSAASPLPDERAYAMLEKTCSSGRFDSLRLYKLYVRMQGFAPLME
jgi:hypothetical protein